MWTRSPAPRPIASRAQVLFLVNGAAGSAAGERAERIAAQLEPGSADIVYRDGGRRLAVKSMAIAIRRARPQVVYAMDLAVANIAAWALASPRTPLVVDTGDTPRQFLDLVGAGPVRRGGAAALERVGYSRSRRIVVRGTHHADQLRDRGLDHVAVIPDGVDLSFFRPHDVWELRRRLGLHRDLTVGIQGNFTWYPSLGGGLGWELIEAMGRFPHLPVRAVIIGSGPGIRQMRLLADHHGIADRVHVMGRIPYRDLPRYLSLCDVTLLTQTNDPSSWARTTGKLPGYLAAGRHILATRVGTAAQLLPEDMLLDYHGGWDTTYPDRLGARLAELSDDPSAVRHAGLQLCELAEPFDYDEIARRCAEEIRTVAA